MEIKIIDSRINEFGFAPSTDHAAGYDLRACIDRTYCLHPGELLKVKTGIAIHMNSGFVRTLYEDQKTDGVPLIAIPCAVIMPRSGLGCKGIKPRNTPGLIDADYQGEIIVCLYNESEDGFTLNPMDRIAQLVFMVAFHPKFTPVSEFYKETARGEGGFGSTGAQ